MFFYISAPALRGGAFFAVPYAVIYGPSAWAYAGVQNVSA